VLASLSLGLEVLHISLISLHLPTSPLYLPYNLMEVLDFPPLLAALDAHALWHVSTAPIAHLLWRSFVEPELRWYVAARSGVASSD
jgi:hypothetical protein